jgi:L-asparaginase/Glu-tRNA(Gln) amidotransferase subunit D
MEYEYVKSDTKRIQKKLDQLNKKYDDIEHQKELDKIEERCKEINNNSSDDLKSEIWGEIYKDVLELEKKSDTKKKSEKKKKSDK